MMHTIDPQPTIYSEWTQRRPELERPNNHSRLSLPLLPTRRPTGGSFLPSFNQLTKNLGYYSGSEEQVTTFSGVYSSAAEPPAPRNPFSSSKTKTKGHAVPTVSGSTSSVPPPLRAPSGVEDVGSLPPNRASQQLHVLHHHQQQQSSSYAALTSPTDRSNTIAYNVNTQVLRDPFVSSSFFYTDKQQQPPPTRRSLTDTAVSTTSCKDRISPATSLCHQPHDYISSSSGGPSFSSSSPIFSATIGTPTTEFDCHHSRDHEDTTTRRTYEDTLPLSSVSSSTADGNSELVQTLDSVGHPNDLPVVHYVITKKKHVIIIIISRRS